MDEINRLIKQSISAAHAKYGDPIGIGRNRMTLKISINIQILVKAE